MIEQVAKFVTIVENVMIQIISVNAEENVE